MESVIHADPLKLISQAIQIPDDGAKTPCMTVVPRTAKQTRKAVSDPSLAQGKGIATSATTT